MTTLRVPAIYDVIEQPASLGGFRLSLRQQPTTDSATRVGRDLGTRRPPITTLDALLNAVNSGKALALGDLWDGLKRVRDDIVERAEKLDTPLVPPRILTSEPTPAELDLGLVYSGVGALKAFADQVEAAQATEAAAKASVGRFREAVGTGSGGQVMRTGDTRHAGLAPSKPVGDFSRPISVDDVQRRNDEHWNAEAAATPFSEYKRR